MNWRRGQERPPPTLIAPALSDHYLGGEVMKTSTVFLLVLTRLATLIRVGATAMRFVIATTAVRTIPIVTDAAVAAAQGSRRKRVCQKPCQR